MNDSENTKNNCDLCGRDLIDAIPGVEFTLWQWPNDELIKFCTACVGPEPGPDRMAELQLEIIDRAIGMGGQVPPGHA